MFVKSRMSKNCRSPVQPTEVSLDALLLLGKDMHLL